MRRGDRAAVGRGIDAVDEALALRVALREVERQLVALDGDVARAPRPARRARCRRRRWRPRRYRCRRELADLLAHRPLGAVEHLLDAGQHGVLAVLVEQRDRSGSRTASWSRSWRSVDLHASGQRTLFQISSKTSVRSRPRSIDLDRRDADPLGVDVVAVGEVAARERAAGVHLVAAAQREEQQLALVEDRAEKAPVGQVALWPRDRGRWSGSRRPD